jgi:hypothetical protein
MARMHKRKILGWGLMSIALILLAAGELLPNVVSLFATFGAMLVGGIGLYFAFDDTSDRVP